MSFRCGVMVNVTIRTHNISYDEYAAVELYKGYSDSLLLFSSVCCVVSMIIGIPGNILTIVALANYKKVHNATALFIMNLSFTDLLLLCLDPPLAMSAYLRRSWIHGRPACQLYAFPKCMLIAASVFTVLAITINRYVLIVYPRLYRKIYQTRNLIIMLTAIWISPLLLLISTYLEKWGCFDLDTDDGPCSIVPDQHERSSKTFLFIVVLGLPSIVIVFCYGRIFCIVRKTTKKSQKATIEGSNNQESISSSAIVSKNRKEKIDSTLSEYSEELETPGNADLNEDKDKEIQWKRPRNIGNFLHRSVKFFNLKRPTRKDKRLGTMIIVIIISFWLCNLPTVLTVVISGMTFHPTLNITAHVLLCVSCCLNPAIYVVMSNEYRQAYNNLFKHRLNLKNTIVNFS